VKYFSSKVCGREKLKLLSLPLMIHHVHNRSQLFTIILFIAAMNMGTQISFVRFGGG
jgi:hypothetical protein